MQCKDLICRVTLPQPTRFFARSFGLVPLVQQDTCIFSRPAFHNPFPTLQATWPRLDFTKANNLTFRAPDNAKYPAMAVAYAAGRAGGTMTGVLSAANEQAVQMFIDEQIKYLDIMKVRLRRGWLGGLQRLGC